MQKYTLFRGVWVFTKRTIIPVNTSMLHIVNTSAIVLLNADINRSSHAFVVYKVINISKLSAILHILLNFLLLHGVVVGNFIFIKMDISVTGLVIHNFNSSLKL